MPRWIRKGGNMMKRSDSMVPHLDATVDTGKRASVWLATSASVPDVQFSSHSGSTTQTTKGDRNE
jgi:hypothetical protein